MSYLKMTFPSDVSLSDWMRGELHKRLSNRYKLTHLSEDSDLNYAQLWRFCNSKPVSEQFLNDVFKYLITSGCVLE